MTAIIGLSAFYHDSAACLVVDGRIVAAAQEERFSRRKHDPAFPVRALEYCLTAGGLTLADVSHVAYYETPLLKFDRLMETYVSFAPDGFTSFREAMPEWLNGKWDMARTLRRLLGPSFRGRLVFPRHHDSHAASAFYASPFDDAAIVTVDGVGEWATTTISHGSGARISPHAELRFPHSLGLLYSAFTSYCGFGVNAGEYKLMGLAPYGRPRFLDQILRTLIDIRPDGSFWLDMRYFNYCQGLTMTHERFHDAFGGPPRVPEGPLEQRHMDLAASVQAVTEQVLLALAHHAHQRTGASRLVMAGGVALNCVANGRLLRDGPFQDIWVQPASGDAGGALGAALYTWHEVLQQPRAATGTDGQRGSLLGPSFDHTEVCAALERAGLTYTVEPSIDALVTTVAGLLADRQVVGWFQGPMEFGPRALGARSILADPRCPDMQNVLNLRIKRREGFRPFAPVVLADQAHLWFEWPRGHEGPYMTMTAAVRTTPSGDSPIPAVTHVDGSARLQTVDRERAPMLWHLLIAFHERTGCPVLVNTSFNVRGEPVVCTPDEAIRCFLTTEMDTLVLGQVVVRKPARAEGERAADTSAPAAADVLRPAGWIRRNTLVGAIHLEHASTRAGRLVSTALLALLFWGIVTPIAVTFRLMGRDVLVRRRRASPSYWQRLQPSPRTAPSVPDSAVLEFWQFLRTNKKWWLVPVVVFLFLFAVLIALSGPAAAPLIYRLF